jgi:hypothetical protein
MNSAILSKSIRLQKVFNILLDGNEHTTRDLIRKSGMCAINSICAELRVNGIKIDCQRRGDRWYYKLSA